ncbi:pilus assembly protein PilP [Hydrogenophaga sp. 5NK40-0174]|uniref:pilus assembly protein PilP n=1 Tax=Hydrogenophaga sp. 5NK40-0174 TaxID=3127649 RepID=UPI00310A4350
MMLDIQRFDIAAPRFAGVVLMALLTTVLSACGGSSEEDLSAWMKNERARVRPSIKPIPAPVKFVPESYDVADEMDPFSGERLAAILRGAQVNPLLNSALVEPELQRRKEPLESFPLDNMSMVGSLDKKGQAVALINVNGLLYQVRKGNYLGQNFGKVMEITETEVVLREIVQDATGEWTERTASLLLQEEAN